MIDSQEIEELLKTTKLSSMTDVIHFILDNIIKVINFQPIQDLAARVAQLQKPQGLDSIMIQQAKALMQAILQQKQDQIRRDLQKSIHNNVSLAIQHQSTRRSMRQLDLMQIMSNKNTQKSTQGSENKSSNFNFQQQSQLDLIKRQINDLKILIERKPDRRQINDLKIQIQKQLSNKIAINQTEKIIQKFQRDIFAKLTQTSHNLQKIQYQLKKSILNQFSIIKKDFNDCSKMVQLKQKITKVQKKIKKIGGQYENFMDKITNQIKINSKQSKQSVQQICSLIENIDVKIKTNSDGIKSLSTKIHIQNQKYFENAAWYAENKINVKNMAISWQKELANQNQQVFKFEAGKSQIIITQPGFYHIQSYVSGCQKAPQLYINSQIYMYFDENSSSKFIHFTINETIKMNEGVSKIWIRLNNQTNYTQALLKISKVG